MFDKLKKLLGIGVSLLPGGQKPSEAIREFNRPSRPAETPPPSAQRPVPTSEPKRFVPPTTLNSWRGLASFLPGGEKPSEALGISFADFTKELPSASVEGIKKARDLGVGVARGVAKVPEQVARTGLEAGLTLTEKIPGMNPIKDDPWYKDFKGAIRERDYDNPVTNFLYGKEPVSSYPKQGEDISKALAIATGNKADNPDFKKTALPIGVGLGLLDFTGWGGKAAKKLVEEGAEKAIQEGAERVARTGADELAKVAEGASRLPRSIGQVKPEPRPTVPEAPKPGDIKLIPPAKPPERPPTIQEALAKPFKQPGETALAAPEPRPRVSRVARELDWEENYAPRAAKLFDDSTDLVNQAKVAKKAELPALERRRAQIDQEAAALEDDFIRKYNPSLYNEPKVALPEQLSKNLEAQNIVSPSMKAMNDVNPPRPPEPPAPGSMADDIPTEPGVPLEVTNADTIGGEFQRAITDKDAPIINLLKGIEKSTGQEGLVDEFYYNTGLQRRANSIANQELQTSDSLGTALGGLKGRAKDEFDLYVGVRNEISNAQRGLPTTHPIETLEETARQLAPKYEARFNSLNSFYKEWAGKMRSAGLIDEPTYRAFTANNDYTRIQRVLDDLVGPQFGKGKSYSLGNTLARQKRTGSTRDIQPADITAFDYAQRVQTEIQRNQTASGLIDVLMENGIARRLGTKEAVRKNTIKRIVNGKTQVFEVPKDIKEIVENISPYQLGALARIVAFPQRLLRAGATGLSFPFTVANYLKDQVSSAIFSKQIAATHHPANIARGLWESSKDFGFESNNPLWQKFTAHLGDTTQYDFIRNVKSSKQLSREIRRGAAGKYGNMTIHPIRTLEDLNQVTEKATRFQNFKGTYEAAKKAGIPENEALQKATLAAWQNSVDFSRMGNITQVLNLILPYFNAGVQGTRLLGRSFAMRPVATSMKTIGLAGIPLMGVTLWNTADPDRKKVYDNLSDYEKENNIIFVPSGSKQNEDGSYDVWKFPLQKGLSNLIQPIRRGVESFAGLNPFDVAEMAKDFLGAVAGPIETNSLAQAGGSLTPQWVKPTVQQYANKDLFTGKDIVPGYIEDATDLKGNPVPESKKAYEFTSGSARMIGDVLGISPIRVEKFVKDTSGKVGQYAQNAIDNVLASKGLIPSEQIGGVSIPGDFVRRFTKAQGIENYNKSAGAKYYDRREKYTQDFNQNEKSAFDSLHPSKTNFLGEELMDDDVSIYNSAARLDIYNRFPRVFQADKKEDAWQRKNGGFGNPLFDLKDWQVKKVLEKEALPPGAKDPELSNLYDKPWYEDYRTQKSAFFTALKNKAAADGRPWAKTDNPYPETPPQLQKVMDFYSSLPKGTGARSGWIQANPQLWGAMTNQWAMIDNWQNKQRGKRGLAATEGEEGIKGGFKEAYGSSYGSKGGGRGKKGFTPPKGTGTASTTSNLKTLQKSAKVSKGKKVAVKKPNIKKVTIPNTKVKVYT